MTISGGSALPKDEIDRMVTEAEAHAEEDRQRREEAETRNTAEQLVYSTEKFLTDNADKLPDDGKTEVEAALDDLKTALAGHGRRRRSRPSTRRSRRPARSWARRCTPQPGAPARAGGGGRRRDRRRAGGERLRRRRGRRRDRRRRGQVMAGRPDGTGARPPGERDRGRPGSRRPGPAGGSTPRPARCAPRPGDDRRDAAGACARRRRRPRRRRRRGAGGERAPASSTRSAAPRRRAAGRPAAAAGRVRQLPAAGRPRPRRRPRAAVAGVLEALLPVLDDIHLARQHGDLEAGPFAAIADKLEATLGRLGLTRFGEPGETVRPDRPRGAACTPRPSSPRARRTTTVVQVLQPGYRTGRPGAAGGPGAVADPRLHEGGESGWQDRTGSRRTSTRSSASPQDAAADDDQEGVPQAGPAAPPGRQRRVTPPPSAGSRRSARPTRCSPTRSSASSTTPSARWPAAAPGSRRAGRTVPPGGFEDLFGGLFGGTAGGGRRGSVRFTTQGGAGAEPRGPASGCSAPEPGRWAAPAIPGRPGTRRGEDLDGRDHADLPAGRSRARCSTCASTTR